jgi:chromate reductase, NAD(P)H dehydrogenase (quinone)
VSTLKVGYIVGSLSKNSINRKLGKALERLAPAGVELIEIPIKDLPLYNQDFDADYPAEGRALKDALDDVDAVLFITPEYNRSIPGGLKNAIDWASRPWGTNSFSGKPSAVIGASIGAIGTAVAQQQLKAILAFSDSPQMGQPEGYVHFTEGLVTDDGEVTNETTAEFLAGWLRAFQAHVEKNLVAVPA